MNRPTLALALSCLGLLAAVATAADDAETPKPLAEAKASFKIAAKGRDSARLATAVRELVLSVAATGTDKEKGKVRRRLRRCLKHPAVAVKVAALHGYGILALPRSSRDLRSLIDRNRNRRQAHEVVLAVLEAWGLIHDSGTHRELLGYIKVPSHKRERRELAITAARALACYRTETGYRRYRLLHDVMQTFDHVYGSATGFVWPSAAATDWFGAVAPEMVDSFNALTHETNGSYRECSQWWRKNHRRVKTGKPKKQKWSRK